MKMLKRVLAAVIAVVITLSVFAASASAAPAAPEFKFKMTSQTSSEVTFELSLAGGSFNSLDVQIKVSGPIGACKEINMTDAFKKVKSDIEDKGGIVSSAKNTNTVMISFASTNTISNVTSMFTYKFAKKTQNVTSSDYSVDISSCFLTVGNDNIDLTSKAKVTTGYIDFSETSITANYKQTKKINFDSSYSAKQIKWESSNTKVATVDDNGNVKMTGKGTATITAKSTDGKASAQCKVTVKYAWWQWIIIIVLFGWIWY